MRLRILFGIFMFVVLMMLLTIVAADSPPPPPEGICQLAVVEAEAHFPYRYDLVTAKVNAKGLVVCKFAYQEAWLEGN